MLARLWLELLTVGSKLGEKMEAKRHWGGEGGMVGLEISQNSHN